MKKLYTIIAFTFVMMVNANAQWVETTGQCNNVLSFTQVGTTLYAGSGQTFSNSNGVISSTDNGNTWNATGQTVAEVYALASNGTTIFAGYFGFGIELSTNNGATWTFGFTGLGNTNVYALAVSGANIYAGTDAGVFKSTDNGATCTAVNTGLTNLNIRCLTVSGTSIYAGTGHGGVFVSIDSGVNWTAINNGLTNLAVYAIAVNGSTIYAGTLNPGGVFLSTNAGSNWVAVNNGLLNTNVTSLAISGNIVFAATENYVYATTNNGTSWTQVSTGLIPYYMNALYINGTTILAGVVGYPYNGVWIRPIAEMTDIAELQEEKTITIAPNPFISQTTITFSEEQKNTILYIRDVLGNIIEQTTINGKQATIDMTGVSKGIYIVNVQTEKGLENKKVIVQ